MAVVSLGDVKAFLNLNIASAVNDDELVQTMDRAESVLSGRVGPLTTTVVTEKHDAGRNPIVLRRPPVISVTSVVVDGVTTTTGFDLDQEAGLLYGDFGYWSGISRTVQVTYNAGRALLPADLEAALLELTKHLWESQRVARPGNRPGFGGGDMSPEVETGARYLLPYRVQTLIEPYLRPSVA